MMTRKNFLKAGAVLGAAAVAGKLTLDKLTPAREFSPNHQVTSDGITTRAIPSSGEQLPVVGMGSWRSFDVGESTEERAPLQEVLQLFFESGGRVLDSSPQYARSEKVIGDLSRELGITDELFMATKVWTEGEQDGVDQMNASFAKLGVETMDLMQVHNLIDWQVHLKTLREWKDQGRIRYIGVTHWEDDALGDLEKIMQNEPLDFVQIHYSIKEAEAEKRILPLAYDRGIAVLSNRPYASGKLFKAVKGRSLPDFATEMECESWGQLFLKFVISHPAVVSALPATSKPHHLLDNMGAAKGYLPTTADREKIRSFVENIL